MFRKFVVAPVLVAALVAGGYASTAQAAVISTQQALSAERRAATETQVMQAFARDDVRQAMERMGVDPANAEARVASLSDAELMQVQGQIDRLPAGGGALAVIGVVFVVLLILELVGVIDIFKRA
ncbi:PA2779 family protein [Aerolutibacter ruishenii]|uniref:PA2779 family protein n=1 Tax=Aerolutibacter ruishenii TaxID=686800 RepID=A0A562M051_9GAMM|nr:PA2779 family protein [Lysobacter ruishenii]TWI13299.1 hypothetical protein IP93_00461 [Lysobacter ruishenii]